MAANPDNQNNVVALFQFIEELNKLKQKNITHTDDQRYYLPLSEIQDDNENIVIHYRDRLDNDDEHADRYLLSIHKPEFEKCFAPDPIFVDWLEDGWDDYRKEAAVKEALNEAYTASAPGERSSTIDETELFTDNDERVEVYELWLSERNDWVEKQKRIEKTRKVFSDLYGLYYELQKEAETEEIIVANGLLFDRDNKGIRHPVLTRRVKLDYNADTNTVTIEDSDAQSELYTVVFQLLAGINLSSVNLLNEDLLANDYHPLDRNATPDFLKVLVRQLTYDSTYSNEPAPVKWDGKERLMVCNDPCYIVRKRLDGSLKAIEQIVQNIQDTGEVPAPIRELVSGGMMEIPEDTGVKTLEEQLASVGGESSDILLSKEANREQLEIAQRIEKYNAVLVQGPPGTGKTHTIANLMGHFIAQGKSVLVTSYTTKALSVLKEKVAPGLQSLCVSLLDDSNADMEKSVDGITSYMSRYTSFDLKREMDSLAVERKDVIDQLAAVRRKVFTIIKQESDEIVLNGEAISPSKAAAFICDHTEDLSYIPGPVKSYAPLPLSIEELATLYRSNGELGEEDETELSYNIPDPSQIMTPEQHREAWEKYHNAKDRIQAIREGKDWEIECDDSGITVSGSFGSFSAKYSTVGSLQRLKDYASTIEQIEPWMQRAAVDGKNGGAHRKLWEMLMEQIRVTNEFAESILTERFGHIIVIKAEDYDALKKPYEKIKETLSYKGKISKLTLMMNKDMEPALAAVSIDDHQVQTPEECDIVLHSIELQALKKKCAVYWNELLASETIPAFYDLDPREPERIAANWLPLITRYLDWYQNDYDQLANLIQSNGLPADILFSKNILDSDLTATGKTLDAIKNVLPFICDIEFAALETRQIKSQLAEARLALTQDGCDRSAHCRALTQALFQDNYEDYSAAYRDLLTLYQKYDLQSARRDLLAKLEPYAHAWAEAIRTRSGLHGESSVPSNIEDAWKWIQLSQIISDLTSKPFADLQAESIRLSKEYRRVTAKYAEKSGWYHLLKRTEADIDMKQALQGWKLTIKRIGKGTGKSAPALKAEARKLMAKCQNAVPGWIMPINRALESLNPKTNRYDIIIIDEASQADISSLAILYMGRKLIIVGDDKQVSPMAVGVEIDKMSSLEQMYLKGRIPNSHLYNAKTSIYDIAATTFQPLMLREHFRCVPEIIGFSNALSYDGKIKPLRDASESDLLPAVVNYRVADGVRQGKRNYNEAKTIVALMQACMEQPEYANKSFGVISLLGDEQVKLIQQMIERELEPKEIKRRNLLCGNSANFQGDERDVVFLSLVDSGTEGGPINMLTFGPDDSYRKRYNVAASRARDQLWVVDSLDPANDLKPGDLRKRLIEYSINPQSFQQKEQIIEETAESPFEESVAKALTNLGYHLELQRPVGAYRLDIVAVCGEKTVAIECDGERWHSGEAKIREDMERQTILERLGWRFIRIRGSEYYRDPKASIDRVVNLLSKYGIEPEDYEEVHNTGRETELLKRVKLRAHDILDHWKGDEDPSVIEKAIEFGLGSFDRYADPYSRRNSRTKNAASRSRAAAPTAAVPTAATQKFPAPPANGKVNTTVATVTSESSPAPTQKPAGFTPNITEAKPVTPVHQPQANTSVTGNNNSPAPSYPDLVKIFTITWDIDGRKIQQKIDEGQLPEAPKAERKPTERFHFFFKKWNTPVKPATANKVYFALFEREDHVWDAGTVVTDTGDENYGKKVYKCRYCGYTRVENIPESAPQKPTSSAQVPTNSDRAAPGAQQAKPPAASNSAKPFSAAQYVTVTWSIDGKETQRQVRKGSVPFAPSAEKEPDELAHYIFKFWDKPIRSVTDDTTYTAIFMQELHRWGSETVVEEPTSNKKGTKVCTCKVCRYTKTFDISPVEDKKEAWAFDSFSWHNISYGKDIYALASFRSQRDSAKTKTIRREAEKIKVRNVDDRSIEETYSVDIAANVSPDGQRHTAQKVVLKRVGPRKTSQPSQQSQEPLKVTDQGFRRYLEQHVSEPIILDLFARRRRLAHLFAQDNIDPELSLYIDNLDLIKKTISELKADPNFVKADAAGNGTYFESLRLFEAFATEVLTGGSVQQGSQAAGGHKAPEASAPSPQPTRSRADMSPVTGTLKRGERVYHTKFGYGTVSWVDKNFVQIVFEQEGERKLNLDFCKAYKLLFH